MTDAEERALYDLGLAPAPARRPPSADLYVLSTAWLVVVVIVLAVFLAEAAVCEAIRRIRGKR